jgi:hypothetical protein
VARPAFACEPVLPFIQAAAPMTVTGSLIVLAIAVALKCALFAIFEKGIPRPLAAIFMFLGNVVSSIIGVIAAAVMGTPGAWIPALAIVFGLSWIPGRRIAQVAPRWTAAGVAALLTITFWASVIAFLFSQAAAASEHLVLYWVIKLIAIYIALIASIALSATWEEALIWMLKGRPANTTYFPAVIRANIYVLLFIMLFGAVVMLPRRLRSPDFLTKSRAHPHLVAAKQQQRDR